MRAADAAVRPAARSADQKHVRLAQLPHPERVHRPAGRGAADRVAGRRRPARNPSGAARGRRQLQRRQGLHRSRPRPRHGPGGAAQPVAGAAGREDRPRRAAGALCRHRGRPDEGRAEAAGRAAARPAGRGQDDHVGQAGALAEAPGQEPGDGVHRRAPSRRDPAARDRRRAGRREGVRAGHDGPGGAREGRARRGAGPRATTRSSSTPPAACTSTTT